MEYNKMTKQELLEYIETLPNPKEFEVLKQKYETSKQAATELQSSLDKITQKLATLQTEYAKEVQHREHTIKEVENKANQYIAEKLKDVTRLAGELEYTQGILGSQVDLIRLLDKERQNNSETLTKMIAIYEKAILKIENEED